jgi:ABC-type hemin transport system substrate-binding protein
MTAKTKTALSSTVKIPHQGSYDYPVGSTLYVFVKGTEAYEQFEIGSTVDMEQQTSGRKHTAVVATVSVGPLIDLLTNYGSQSFAVYGKPYTAKGLIKALGAENGEDVVDVTKLYTAVGFTLNPPATEVDPALTA